MFFTMCMVNIVIHLSIFNVLDYADYKSDLFLNTHKSILFDIIADNWIIWFHCDMKWEELF